MVQTTILQAISSGNVTVEQIKSTTHLSPKAIEVGIQELIENGIIAIDGNGNYYNSYSYGGNEVTPKNTSKQTNQGDNMNKKELKTTKKNEKQLNCTPEQLAFSRAVVKNKGRIFDAQNDGQVFTHRGAQVLFGGAGNQSLRYKIAVSGFSDKEPVEHVIMYLDWDDTALYEEGGLADQIKEVIGQGQPDIAPAITATVIGGK